MIKRFWSVFIFLFVTILAFAHYYGESQMESENGKVLAQMRGGGLAFTRREIAPSSEDEKRIGTNLFAGIDIPLRRFPIQPFVEACWTFVDNETLFHLAVGFNVLFGGGRGIGL